MFTVKQPFFSTDESTNAGFSQSWGDVLRNSASDDADTSFDDSADDEQPDEDSDAEVVEEDDSLIDGDDEDNEQETQDEPSETVVEEDPDIDLGEGRKPVKMSELKQGYLRQSDYTKKTQELATQRKDLETREESLKPVSQWLDHMNDNPWLYGQINKAIEDFNQTGILPLDEVLQDAQYGAYINQLMADNQRLKKELESVTGEYEGVKLSASMDKLRSELRDEYGDLVTDDYMQKLSERGKNEKLSTDTLKEIAEGFLAKEQLKATKTNVTNASKKAEAKAIQKLAETKKTAPSAPKTTGVTPGKEVKRHDGWGSLFRSISD